MNVPSRSGRPWTANRLSTPRCQLSDIAPTLRFGLSRLRMHRVPTEGTVKGGQLAAPPGPMPAGEGPDHDRSVGVDELPNRGDLPAQLVVAGRLASDLVAGVQHRGMVAPTQLGADAQERDVGLLAHQEHRDLARHDDRLVALLAAEGLEWNAVVLGHRDR